MREEARGNAKLPYLDLFEAREDVLSSQNQNHNAVIFNGGDNIYIIRATILNPYKKLKIRTFLEHF